MSEETAPSLPQDNDDAAAATVRIIRCEECGHELPATNLDLHRIACHNNSRSNNNSIRQQQQQQQQAAEVVLMDEEQPDTPIETVLNNAGQRQQHYSNQQQQQPSTAAAIIVPSSSTAAAAAADTTSTSHTNSSENNALPESLSSQQQEQQQEEWSCPRCTLLNPVAVRQCAACGGFYHQTNNEQGPAAATIDNGASPVVEVHETDPRVVTAVSGAVSVLSWSALGGLVAGPVGAAVGGTAGLLMAAGAASQQHWQQQGGGDGDRGGGGRRQRRPRFTFTSTRISETGGADGGTTTMRVTTNSSADGRMRTVIVRAPPGSMAAPGAAGIGGSMALVDRMILQMLYQNALTQQGRGAVDQMTYDELLERFGVGTEHRRGASPETIRSLPLVKLNDDAALASLSDSQKTCNICLEDFVVGDEMRRLPNCDHAFHAPCIDRWLATVSSCPICKKEISEQEQQQQHQQQSHHHHHNNG